MTLLLFRPRYQEHNQGRHHCLTLQWIRMRHLMQVALARFPAQQPAYRLGRLHKARGLDDTMRPIPIMPIREECPDTTVADPAETVDAVATDQTEVEVLVGMGMDPVVVVEAEDPAVVAVEVEHPAVQVMEQAAMVAAVAVVVVDFHSHLPTSIRCPLQRLRSSASSLT